MLNNFHSVRRKKWNKYKYKPNTNVANEKKRFNGVQINKCQRTFCSFTSNILSLNAKIQHRMLRN